MNDTTADETWATHEPPWAGLLDKMADAAKAEPDVHRRPQRRAHDLVAQLDKTVQRINPGADFWYSQANAQRFDDTTDPEPADDDEDDKPAKLEHSDDCLVCNPQPRPCEYCGQKFGDDHVRRAAHLAVYGVDGSSETHRERKELLEHPRRRR